MIWKILHKIGIHRREITRVHVMDNGMIVYETKCLLCGKFDTHIDLYP